MGHACTKCMYTFRQDVSQSKDIITTLISYILYTLYCISRYLHGITCYVMECCQPSSLNFCAYVSSRIMLYSYSELKSKIARAVSSIGKTPTKSKSTHSTYAHDSVLLSQTFRSKKKCWCSCTVC